MPRALLVAAILLVFVTLAGPGMLRGAVPFLSFLPPGALFDFASGFATTGPLLLGSLLVALGLRRLLPNACTYGTALAAVATVAWEAFDIGLATMIATGPVFVLGRVAGFAVAIIGVIAAGWLGRRLAKGLAPAAASLARGSTREER
jgi:hypothetical protein